MKKYISLFVLFLTLCYGCSKGSIENEAAVPEKKDSLPTNPPVKLDTLRKSTYNLALLDYTKIFYENPEVTVLENQQHQELSGIAASQVYKDILYTHEDSGNKNEIYITNKGGKDLGKIVLDGVYNRDWEDISYGPGPDANKKYIYVAEIGDNDAKYPNVVVYRFQEPIIDMAKENNIKVTPDKFTFVYPGGAVNAEALLLDPLTKNIYILTKEYAKSILYVARYPYSSQETTKLVALGQFPFDKVTAADISVDGTELLVRNTGQIWYWKRKDKENIIDMMMRDPQNAPYAANERQGEAICFAADNSGYYTTSEIKKYPGTAGKLSFYLRK